MKLTFSIAFLAAMLASIVGWFINLFDVIGLAIAEAPLTALFILKAVGILVAPLGGILGLFF